MKIEKTYIPQLALSIKLQNWDCHALFSKDDKGTVNLNCVSKSIVL